MIKNKNKTMHTPLVVTGYILFSLLVIATLLSTTIPWGQMLIANLTRVSHYNLAVFFVALTVGAVLPALIGYIVGNSSVKSKSKLSHHFNGVLFGLLAFWIMIISAMLVSIPSELFSAQPNERVILINLLPCIGVAIITTIIAIVHARSRQSRHDILSYKPFSMPLIASVAVLPLWSLINNISTNSVSIYSFVSLLTVLVPGVVSYATLRKVKLSTYDKMVWSAVSVSVFFVASYVSSQLISVVSDFFLTRPTMEIYTLLEWGSFILALVAWGAYWIWQTKALRKK